MKGQTLWTRVWTKVEIVPGGCWLWKGALSKKRFRGKQLRRPNIQLAGRKSPNANPARVVCEWFHGPPPNSLYEAGHTCPNGEHELCMNPDHLTWMTREQNERYKHTKEPA